MKLREHLLNKRLIVTIATLVILIIVGSIIAVNYQADPNIKVVRDVAESYFYNIQAGNYENSINMVYFKEKNMPFKKMILRAYGEDKLLSYKITKVVKLTDSLYEVHTSIETLINEKGESVNYVGLIDGNWKYIINKENIPDEIDIFPYSPEEDAVITPTQN